MKKILIDLDVITVGIWDKGKNGDLARNFIARIVNKEFYVVTPFLLLERISKWGHIGLTKQMKEFYVKNSDILLTDDTIAQKFDEVGAEVNGFNEAVALKELRRNGVGSQDAFLVLIASIFGLTLVTFNRKTLRSREEKIKEVMNRHGINPSKLVGPEEL